MKYFGHRKLLCELSKLQNFMLLTSSDTKRTLMHLFLLTNSAQTKLVSMCTQSIRYYNKLSLHNNLGCNYRVYTLYRQVVCTMERKAVLFFSSQLFLCYVNNMYDVVGASILFVYKTLFILFYI